MSDDGILRRVRGIYWRRYRPLAKPDTREPLPDEQSEADAQQWARAILAGASSFDDVRAVTAREVGYGRRWGVDDD